MDIQYYIHLFSCNFVINVWYFSGGLRRCAVGGVVGFGLSAAYCLWTSRDRLESVRRLSLPTFCMASAMMLPMVVSLLAEMLPT